MKESSEAASVVATARASEREASAARQALTLSRSYTQYLIVTDHAIVHVERRSAEEVRQVSTITLIIGGILGPLLAALTDWTGRPGGPTPLYLRFSDMPPLREITDVTKCWVADVPADLAAEPSWPPVEPYRPVTFYPRGLIESVALSRFCGLRLTLQREAGREVRLSLPPWHHARLREHLVRAGYPLTDQA